MSDIKGADLRDSVLIISISLLSLQVSLEFGNETGEFGLVSTPCDTESQVCTPRVMEYAKAGEATKHDILLF